MAWIVIGEDNGKIKLVSKTHSKNEQPGILPKGSFLTIDNTDTGSKFILRVDDSIQYEPYSPSPLIVDMDLSGLMGDIKCQNIIKAYRVKTSIIEATGRLITFRRNQLLGDQLKKK